MSELQVIPEKSDAWLKLTLKDEAGDELEVGAINTLFWTLYDEETGGIINSRTDVAESVTTNPHYIRLEPDDNVIVTAAKARELHVVELLIGYDSDRGSGLTHREKIDVYVENLGKVS